MYRSISNFSYIQSKIVHGHRYKLPHGLALLLQNGKSDDQIIHKYGVELQNWAMTIFRNKKLGTKKFRLFANFWGISKPFCDTRYHKIMECRVKKLSQGRANNTCVQRCLKTTFSIWRKRWFALGYNNIWYYDSAEDDPIQIKDNVHLDVSTNIQIDEITNGFLVLSIFVSRRKFTLRVKDLCNGLTLLHSLLKALCLSNYTKFHQFKSFAPRRERNDCEFYTRGEGYFKAVYERLSKAKYEIMICGWMISPEMPLLRPSGKPSDKQINFPSTTLMSVLKEAADKRNVHVYVLVYDEFEMSLYNDSEWAKKQLENLNPKLIKVIRHPQNLIFYWSHHEKMIIVDRKVVFMGGLDLAWGRWDNADMNLFDFTPNEKMFPGMDFYNPFVKEFVKGRQFKHKLFKDPSIPRIPWQDYGIRLKGPIVLDFLTHFVTYWNHGSEIDKSVEEPLLTQIILAQYE
jgi:hypothetical protein